jgi:Uma2 family endonuclease
MFDLGSVEMRLSIRFPTFADVLARVGGVAAERVLCVPAPGTATEADFLAFSESQFGHRDVELVDGILVARVPCLMKARLSPEIGYHFGVYLHNVDNRGCLFSSRAPFRLRDGLVRKPSLSFVAWDSLDDPEAFEACDDPIADLAPDFLVEFWTHSNTATEMSIKLDEYAKAGVKLVWYVDPATQTVTFYKNAKASTKLVLGLDGVLDGGKVLPGFKLPVKEIFARRAPKKTRKSKK